MSGSSSSSSLTIPTLVEFRDANIKDNASQLANPTGILVGQIPEIYFKVVEDDNDDLMVL
jgi:hypothetical protein